MKSTSGKVSLFRILRIVVAVAWACLCVSVLCLAQQSTAKKSPAATNLLPRAQAALTRRNRQPMRWLTLPTSSTSSRSRGIFGPDGEDIVFSGEFAQDRQHAADFAAEAHEKKSVSVDPKNGSRAFLLVGNEDWPFPVPIVKQG